VDPVSRRDFWAILYRLVKDGLTVMVTTAYLDEAERANRVGLMHRGRLIRCDTPTAMREDLDHAYFDIKSDDERKTREILEQQRGVLAVQPTGAKLRLYVDGRETSAEELAAITPFTWQRIAPSLEDVFIALVREQELAHAA
jgi:ABC-2 type transport system ATP-binding protein